MRSRRALDLLRIGRTLATPQRAGDRGLRHLVGGGVIASERTAGLRGTPVLIFGTCWPSCQNWEPLSPRGCALQSLRQARCEGEDAAIGQLGNDAIERADLPASCGSQDLTLPATRPRNISTKRHFRGLSGNRNSLFSQIRQSQNLRQHDTRDHQRHGPRDPLTS
jgi:hypothetical protein